MATHSQTATAASPEEHRIVSLPSALSEHPAACQQRRTLLGILLAGASGMVGAALSAPLVRFAAYPLHESAEEAAWSDVGKLEEFESLSAPVARTIHVDRIDGWQRSQVENGVYVVPGETGRLRVLSSVCPHLGCSLRWTAGAKHFVCPCHGGTFNDEGVHIAGPPRRAMDELESKIENNVLKVRFQRFRQMIAEKEPIG